MTEPAPVLELIDVSRSFAGGAVRAVDGVSLEVFPGEIVSLLGPSGCGKTTTLRMVARLGLEHHAIKSAPDIEALRDSGVESPSGRLVVDISRLREKRALSSGSNEIKVLGSKPAEKPAPEIEKPAPPSSFLDKVKRILGL